MMKSKSLLIAATALGLVTSASQAAITTVHEYQMGEDAAGTDSVGGLNLAMTGSVTSVSSGVAGSTSALNFSGNPSNGGHEGTATNYLDGATAPTITGSWGVEMWVNPSALPDGSSQFEVGLIHIGGTGGGLALEIASHPTWADGTVNWMVHRTGAGATNHNAAAGGVTAPTTGVWTHLAYVYDEVAGASLYVNGTASSVAPHGGNTGTGDPDMTIGSMWADNRRGFNGDMDAVRLFTFNSGEFDISDTYVSGVPEPSSLALFALGSLALLRRRHR